MTAADAPGLPLVIGIPFLCMFVAAILIGAVWYGMGRMGWR